MLPALVVWSGGANRLHLLEIHAPEIKRELGILQRRGGSTSVASGEFVRLCQEQGLLAQAHRMAGDSPAAKALLETGLRWL